LVALHPARATFLARGQHLDVVMLALAAVAAVPSLVYAWRMASAQRHDLPPADAVSNGLHHWTVMTTLALLVPLLVLMSALRTMGWRIPGNQRLDCGRRMGDLLSPCAGVGSAGSEGHAWGWSVIGWAAGTFTASLWPRARDRVHASALAPDAWSGYADPSLRPCTRPTGPAHTRPMVIIWE
jgi:hypothetical protein